MSLARQGARALHSNMLCPLDALGVRLKVVHRSSKVALLLLQGLHPIRPVLRPHRHNLGQLLQDITMVLPKLWRTIPPFRGIGVGVARLGRFQLVGVTYKDDKTRKLVIIGKGVCIILVGECSCMCEFSKRQLMQKYTKNSPEVLYFILATKPIRVLNRSNGARGCEAFVIYLPQKCSARILYNVRLYCNPE